MPKYSFQPCRTKAYGEDIRWRMVYQRHMTGLTCEQIAANLNIDTSTVYRNRGADTSLTVYHELFILQTVLENPSVYLHEIQRRVAEVTTTLIDESTICCYLHRPNFSRKKTEQDRVSA